MGAPRESTLTLEVEIDYALDSGLLSDVEWFMLSGGTPRKERGHRRNRAKSWRFIDLCAWIGKKVNIYNSIIRCE
jgi:hypothetical protein